MECTDKEPHGPFEARVFIQGVANYVPHTDGDRLLVLFPNQGRYHTHPFPAVPSPPRGEPGSLDEICDHHAVVQMDLRHLVRDGQPVLELLPWTTLHVEGHWLGFESDGGEDTLRFPRKHDKGSAVTVPGVPHIQSLLAGVGLGHLAAIDESVLPKSSDSTYPAHMVTAGVYIDKGIVSSASEFEGAFSFHEIGSIHSSIVSLLEEEIFSGVVRIELGTVNGLKLVLRAFDGSEIIKIPLQPIGDTLDIWVRHFCDLRPPDPEHNPEEGSTVDRDFRLNYLLLHDLPNLLVQAGNRLPIPRTAATWLRGGPIGGEPIRCMGGGGGGSEFVSPFLDEALPEAAEIRQARIRR